MKTNKSFTKRIRVTKKGKLVVRKKGQDHYNAQESGNTRRAKNKDQALAVSNRVRRSYLSKASS